MITIDRVTKAISYFVKNSEPFTLLDLTEKIKLDGDGWISHSVVRDISKPLVDSMIENGLLGNYVVSEIYVNTLKGSAIANLYHPISFDSDDYTKRSQVATPPPTQTNDDALFEDEDDDVEDALVTDDVEDEVDFDDDALFEDDEEDEDVTDAYMNTKLPGAHSIFEVKPRNYDGKIEIPKSALKESGLLGVPVHITLHPNSMTITKVSYNGVGSVIKTLYSGYRISKSQLKTANLFGKRVILGVFTDKIVVCY